MAQKSDIHVLLSVLQSVGYPFINEIAAYKELEEVNVEDFLRIIACIGNFMSKHVTRSGQPIFPYIYQEENRRIFSDDREKCCQMIRVLSLKINFTHIFTKTEINSSTKRWAKERAEFIRWMCAYWRQVFDRSPTPSVSEPELEEAEVFIPKNTSNPATPSKFTPIPVNIGTEEKFRARASRIFNTPVKSSTPQYSSTPMSPLSIQSRSPGRLRTPVKSATPKKPSTPIPIMIRLMKKL